MLSSCITAHAVFKEQVQCPKHQLTTRNAHTRSRVRDIPRPRSGSAERLSDDDKIIYTNWTWEWYFWRYLLKIRGAPLLFFFFFSWQFEVDYLFFQKFEVHPHGWTGHQTDFCEVFELIERKQRLVPVQTGSSKISFRECMFTHWWTQCITAKPWTIQMSGVELRAFFLNLNTHKFEWKVWKTQFFLWTIGTNIRFCFDDKTCCSHRKLQTSFSETPDIRVNPSSEQRSQLINIDKEERLLASEVRPHSHTFGLLEVLSHEPQCSKHYKGWIFSFSNRVSQSCSNKLELGTHRFRIVTTTNVSQSSPPTSKAT